MAESDPESWALCKWVAVLFSDHVVGGWSALTAHTNGTYATGLVTVVALVAASALLYNLRRSCVASATTTTITESSQQQERSAAIRTLRESRDGSGMAERRPRRAQADDDENVNGHCGEGHAAHTDGRDPVGARDDRGAAAADTDTEVTQEDLSEMLDAARARLEVGDADGALGFALAAMKFSAGGNFEVIAHALDAAKAKAQADRARVMRNYPGISEADASMMAAADAVRDDMLSRPSVLADHGRTSLLREAMESGSEVVCIRCGALVLRRRADEHRTMWCARLDDDEVTYEDSTER